MKTAVVAVAVAVVVAVAVASNFSVVPPRILIAPGHSALDDQLRRAALSVPLNVHGLPADGVQLIPSAGTSRMSGHSHGHVDDHDQLRTLPWKAAFASAPRGFATLAAGLRGPLSP